MLDRILRKPELCRNWELSSRHICGSADKEKPWSLVQTSLQKSSAASHSGNQFWVDEQSITQPMTLWIILIKYDWHADVFSWMSNNLPSTNLAKLIGLPEITFMPVSLKIINIHWCEVNNMDYLDTMAFIRYGIYYLIINGTQGSLMCVWS